MIDADDRTTEPRVDEHLPMKDDLWLSVSSSEEVVLILSRVDSRVRYVIMGSDDTSVRLWETQLSLFMVQYQPIVGSRPKVDPAADAVWRGGDPQPRKLMLDDTLALIIIEDGWSWSMADVRALCVDVERPLPVISGQLKLRLQQRGYALLEVDALGGQVTATVKKKGAAIES